MGGQRKKVALHLIYPHEDKFQLIYQLAVAAFVPLESKLCCTMFVLSKGADDTHNFWSPYFFPLLVDIFLLYFPFELKLLLDFLCQRFNSLLKNLQIVRAFRQQVKVYKAVNFKVPVIIYSGAAYPQAPMTLVETWLMLFQFAFIFLI